MPTPVVMPGLGMFTTEGTLVNWLHPDGTPVAQGQDILEIETDKAVNSVVAPASGTLRHLLRQGTLIKDQDVLGYILAAGESLEDPAPAPRAAAHAKAVASPAKVENPTASAGARSNIVKVSPLARKLASELGVDLTAVTGSGPGGRIVEKDVLERKTTSIDQTTQSHVTLATTGTPSDVVLRRVPFSPMRRAIGDRLLLSARNAVPVTLTREIQAEVLVAARQSLSERLGSSVPYDALFLKAMAAALRERPELASMIDGDSLIAGHPLHLGFAVSVPEGLYAPVIRNVDALRLSNLVTEMKRLTLRARAQSLLAEELAGGVATITNLGAYGVDAFTPVLNPPQTTILGIGRIAPRPVAQQGTVRVAQTCWLSLTFDHRVTDGTPAAQALDIVARLMGDAAYLEGLDRP